MSINCNDVVKTFRSTRALDGASCSFPKGHIIGLLGRNGAGKSTLIKCIGNRLYATSGSITMDGNEIYKSPRDYERITIVGDENMLPSSTKLKDVFQMMDDMDIGSYEKAMELSKKFKLDPKKKWEKLSTGYRTIFKDILGLSSNREYVFFDEPILGLDANHRELFYEELLASFSPERCFVVATHLIEEISPLVDKVVIIDNGKVLKESDKDSLLSSVRLVSGNKDAVEDAIRGMKVITKTTLIGQERAMVEGEIENDNVTVDHVDLQRYFIEITKDGE